VQVTLAFKGNRHVPGYVEWAKVWGKRANAPKALGLARPEMLVAISAIAVLP